MTRNGALAGMVVGALTVLVWQYFQWLAIYEIIPGFVFSTLAIVVVSLLDKQPSSSMQDIHRQVNVEIDTRRINRQHRPTAPSAWKAGGAFSCLEQTMAACPRQ